LTRNYYLQDAFDSNQLRQTNIDEVISAARKVCFQLGWGGEPLFYDVYEVLENERDEYPCKFDMHGNVIPGREEEPDYYEEDLASNPRHNYPERFEEALERLRQHRSDLEERQRTQNQRGYDTSDEEENNEVDDPNAPLLINGGRP